MFRPIMMPVLNAQLEKYPTQTKPNVKIVPLMKLRLRVVLAHPVQMERSKILMTKLDAKVVPNMRLRSLVVLAHHAWMERSKMLMTKLNVLVMINAVFSLLILIMII